MVHFVRIRILGVRIRGIRIWTRDPVQVKPNTSIWSSHFRVSKLCVSSILIYIFAAGSGPISTDPDLRNCFLFGLSLQCVEEKQNQVLLWAESGSFYCKSGPLYRCGSPLLCKRSGSDFLPKSCQNSVPTNTAFTYMCTFLSDTGKFKPVIDFVSY